MSQGIDVVQQLGDAAISYFGEKGDPAVLQQLVAPSAQEASPRCSHCSASLLGAR